MQRKNIYGLTDKQEKYVHNLVMGMSQRQAYIDAYNVTSTNPNTLDSNACQLLYDTKVLQRYRELQAQLIEPFLMSATDKRRMLQEFANDEHSNKETRMRAIDLDNKMTGEYVEKREVNLKMDDFTINFEND